MALLHGGFRGRQGLGALAAAGMFLGEAILAGLAGSWIGTARFGDFGPSLAGIAIQPAIVGTIILAFAIDLLAKAFVRTTA
ncbi:MAG: GlsB/YeaQ/YmgE family stress response membrane protein [Chloroflexi bacterium]|nr:GlsB/YeaQ/YmgE family stress response membrane protein [Chloroflexota bacterium]